MDKARLLKQLSEAATLEIARAFLADRGLPHSASSWDQMIDDRLHPAIDSGTVSVADLLTLLRECEEHGRQHVFLYRSKKAYRSGLLTPHGLRAALAGAGLDALLAAPRLLDAPSQPTIADARWEQSPFPSVILKTIEKREYWTPTGQSISDGTMTKRYRLEQERAVNVVRLRTDGLLEVRLFRQKNSTDYTKPLDALFGILAPLIDQDQWLELSLLQAKTFIWDKRDSELNGRVQIAQQWAKNAHGVENRLLSTQPDVNLADDAGSSSSMEAFLSADGQHTSSFVAWLPAATGAERDILVNLGGMPHEFVIGRACRQPEYELILADILRFNEPRR